MIKELIKYAHKAKEVGLAINSSGNISVMVDKERFAISSSGTYLGELKKKERAWANASILYFPHTYNRICM